MLALLNDLEAVKTHQQFAYPMRLHDGHVLVESTRIPLLMDTGAPFSVGAGEFPFAGSTVTPRASFGGVTVQNLSKEVGTSLDALVGMDIIAKYDLRFDEPHSLIEITRNEVELSKNAPRLRFNCGIPIVEGNLPGNRYVSLVFDTGAKLSYLGREFLAGSEPYRKEEDFYPTHGRFLTSVYRVSLELAGSAYEVDFGILPDRLEKTLLSGLADGIVGSELLVGREVVLACRRGKLNLIDR
jgi:hypothetical protein